MTDPHIKSVAEGLGEQCLPEYHEGFYHGQIGQFDMGRNYDEPYCNGWIAADNLRAYLQEQSNDTN